VLCIEPSRVVDEGVRDEVRLLGNGGMAGVRDDRDGDAFAEHPLVIVGVLRVRQRVVVRLQVEDRCLSGRVVLLA
jgi:hypothetical protein